MRLISLITHATLGALLLAQEPPRQAEKPHAPSEKAKPAIQIGLVSVDPSVIHPVGESTTATVTVQVYNTGLEEIADPQVSVSVNTYKSTTPISVVQYFDSPQTQTVRVNPAIFKFEVRATKETLPGQITVQANITAASAGIVIHDPDPPTYGRAELKIE